MSNIVPSPMRPVAPPAKKQRSGNDAPLRTRPGADRLTSRADDAIARRRAELRRLQQMRAEKSGSVSSATSTEGLLARARTQLTQPTSMQAPTRQRPPPAVPPHATGVSRVRHSDIFPGVSKPPAPPASALIGPPPVAATTSRSTQPVLSQGVARRLDTSFEEEPPSAPPPKQTSAHAKSAPPTRPPPTEPPPPILAEEPMTGGGTPYPRKSAVATPPSTARRETLQLMRDSVASPESTSKSQKSAADDSSNVRFVRELKQAQEEKASALRKIARLQEQITFLQKQQQKPESETNGSSAHEQQQQQAFSQVGFLSPLANATSSIRVGSMTPGRTRVATPHPKRATDDKAREFLAEATQSTPVEYCSTLATYVVRVPYGSSGLAEKNAEVWSEAGTQSTEAYQMTADVIKPSTLEVVARVKADDSLLTLSGVSTVRHRNGSSQWRVFDDVDGMDKPLGCITFIDENANEKEYWLDAIYEEALATRETYCSALISTASALRARKSRPEINEMHDANAGIPPLTASSSTESRPPVSDACVGTEGEAAQPERVKAPPMPAATTVPEQQPKVPPMEMEPSTDIVSFLLGYLISGAFGLIFWTCVRLPLRVISFTLILSLSWSLLSLVWLILADDHGAKLMGAELGLGFNHAGIV